MGLSSYYYQKNYNSPPKIPNPNPANFEIIKIQAVENFLIVEICYPDCTNFEGHKTLVYENITREQFLKTSWIDPHFQNGGFSPIARFIPTEQGWDYAVLFCNSCTNEKLRA